MLSTTPPANLQMPDVAHRFRVALPGEQVTTIGFDGSASVFMPPPPAGLSMLVPSRYDNSSLREYPLFPPFAMRCRSAIMLDGDALLDVGLMRQNAAEQHGAIQFSEREASLGVSGDRIVVGLSHRHCACRFRYSAGDWFAWLSTTPLTGENNTTLPMALTSEQPVKAIAIATPRTPPLRPAQKDTARATAQDASLAMLRAGC